MTLIRNMEVLMFTMCAPLSTIIVMVFNRELTPKIIFFRFQKNIKERLLANTTFTIATITTSITTTITSTPAISTFYIIGTDWPSVSNG